MNILLPVSRGASFADALRLAADTAKAHDGRVRVLAVVDRGEIRRIERGARPGAIHLARHAAEEVEKRVVVEGTAAVGEATRFCEAAGVPVQGEVREGEPEEELLAAAGGCDLLVSSVASHFAPDMEDPPGRLVLSRMKDGTIPVLLGSLFTVSGGILLRGTLRATPGVNCAALAAGGGPGPVFDRGEGQPAPAGRGDRGGLPPDAVPGDGDGGGGDPLRVEDPGRRAGGERVHVPPHRGGCDPVRGDLRHQEPTTGDAQPGT